MQVTQETDRNTMQRELFGWLLKVREGSEREGERKRMGGGTSGGGGWPGTGQSEIVKLSG